MPLRVASRGGAGEARARETLRVGLPASARPLERIREVATGDRAIGAVAGDALCRAGDERQVVGQARMRERRVVRQRCVPPCEAVERWRRGVTEHGARRLVLEHDHHDAPEADVPANLRSDGLSRDLIPLGCPRARRYEGGSEDQPEKPQRDSASDDATHSGEGSN